MNIAAEVVATVIAGLLILLTVTPWNAARLAIRIPAAYFAAMGKMIDSELSGYAMAEDSRVGRLVRVNRHVDQPRSFPQYFFGQVQVDAKEILDDFASAVRTLLANRWSATAEMIESSNSYIQHTIAYAIRLGVVIGTACGLTISAVIIGVHLLVAVVCAIAAVLAAMILRAADAVIRVVAGVRMVCPVCVHVARPYAIYKCPSCGAGHHDVRSGRRGIFTRICGCGQRMPALLLTGADRLAASCPRCTSPLPPGFGKNAEVLVPFIGSVRAGKTQLMYMLVLALSGLAGKSGKTYELLSESQEEVDRIGKQLARTGSPGPTIPESPEALVMRLTSGPRRQRRYIYLFDPAGELHYRDRGLDELHYLGQANTLVYVADPLAAAGVWDRLGDETKRQLAPTRSDGVEAELSYEMSSEGIRRMGGKKNQMRLAFVVTKVDTLSDLPALTDEDSVRKFVENSEWMDMGNIVRDAMQSFGEVRFFAAAATPGESGMPDTSIEELAEWLTGAKSFKNGRR